MKENENLEILDTCGLVCPEPVMLLHHKIRKMNLGERVQVRASDPTTQRDIPKFCQFLGHQLLTATQVDGLYLFTIQKGEKQQANASNSDLTTKLAKGHKQDG